MKVSSLSLQQRARAGAHIAGAASLLLIASLGAVSAKKGGGGKPGGGDPPPPPEPPAEATVAYEVTWLPGFGGSYTFVEDVNSAGIAVGTANDANGNSWSFIASNDGMVTTDEFFSTGGWQLPAGWVFSSRAPRINEANVFCGQIVSGDPSQYGLVLIDLDAVPGLIEAVATSQQEFPSFRVVDQNEHNDVLMQIGTQPYVYVHGEPGELVPLAGAENTLAVALNDALEVCLQGYDPDSIFGFEDFAYRYSLLTGELEDLSAGLPRNSGSWGHDITNDGTVFGHSIVKRKREAGGVASGSVSWWAIDGALPKDTTAASANESGQVLGGYHVSDMVLGNDRYRFGTELWISHPDDGLFAINDLVTGDAGDVSRFIGPEGFGRLSLSEPSGSTGYGVIAGTSRRAYGETWEGFILTPVAP